MATPANAVPDDAHLDSIRWTSNIPFWVVHIAAVGGAIYYGVSWAAFLVCAISYGARMFGITGGYHRYFSHRTYKTSRVFQFLLALLGVTATQKGPLWWSAHHRRHHKYSDQPEDIHSPRQRGFIWSHFLWILVKRHDKADLSNVKDLSQYPELRILDKYENLVVIGTVALLGILGGGWWVIWAYCVPTVLVWHCTFFINSLAHIIGRRRYETTDDSKNSFLLGIICMGEGWHNNHHHYQRAVNNGFYWYEIDVTYYILRTFAAVGLIWDLHIVPKHVRDKTEAPGRARLADSADAADADAA